MPSRAQATQVDLGAGAAALRGVGGAARFTDEPELELVRLRWDFEGERLGSRFLAVPNRRLAAVLQARVLGDGAHGVTSNPRHPHLAHAIADRVGGRGWVERQEVRAR